MPTNSKRLELHEILCDILESRNVYFQPPESVKMKYPAIVYSVANINSKRADDGVYLSRRQYSVTVICKDPDTDLVDKVAALPLCDYDRHYTADNLNHDVFTLYY